MSDSRIRVAVLGSGNIGIDLCERLLSDPDFHLVALVGRRPDSPGLERLQSRIPYSVTNGIDGFLPISDEVDGVFDATSAFDHACHWNELSGRGKWMVDLTPSRLGNPMVPVLMNRLPQMQVDGQDAVKNFSMVTCGGQSAAPLLYSIVRHAKGISEVEVSSSIAAVSAGPATRLNIDLYIESTENLISLITRCNSVKAILVLNPAVPPVMMRTTVTVEAQEIDLEAVGNECTEIVQAIQSSVPGYSVIVAPHHITTGRVVITAKVTGAEFYLPSYAGNLDIINAAAIETARRHSRAVRQAKGRI